MISLTLPTTTTNRATDGRCYRLARQSVYINRPLEALQCFEDECAGDLLPDASAKLLINRDSSNLIYRGPGWIGNEWREVNCWSVQGGYRIAASGIGECWLTAGGRSIVIQSPPSAAEALLVEFALGPPLILSFALRGIWCLHGSALVFDNQAVFFLGESGKGKSTLARWLDANSEQKLRRIGDDILPVAAGDGSLYALPHFPQLKIPSAAQPSLGMPERLPVAMIYVLTRPEGHDHIAAQALERQKGALSLVRHTVASRLFDSQLMASHLDFCVQAASQTRLKELSYPLTKEALPGVFKALLADLEID